MLNQCRIGTRLAAGFALVLILSILTTGYGLYNARMSAKATQDMIAGPLIKERLAADWYVFIYSAIARTAVIARSTDTSLTKGFATDIAESVKSGTAVSKKLEVLMLTDVEKTKFGQIMALRKTYQAGKEAAMGAAPVSTPESKLSAFDKQFMPTARAYQASVQDLLKLERDTIDDTAREIEAIHQRTQTLMMLMMGLMVALGATMAYLITVSITRPLQRVVEVADRIALGDLTQEVQVVGNDEVSRLQGSIKNMAVELVRLIGDVQGGAATIAGASSEIAAGNLDLSSRTEQQAGSLQTTAATMEELTSAVNVTADNARQANVMARHASDTAIKGGVAVSEVIEKMAAINASAKKIADIISVIDGIAFQTNILALNAAVEAARAGEQGRGFAVVASEVRTLAQRSANAAKEIKALIEDSVARIKEGNALAAGAGSTMEQIVSSVKNSTDIMGEIAAAAEEQRTGIGQVNHAITEMDSVTQQNAALVEEAAAAAQSLQDQAERLAGAVAVFKISRDAAATNPGQPAASRLTAIGALLHAT